MFWPEVWKYLDPNVKKELEKNPVIRNTLEIRQALRENLSFDTRRYDSHYYPCLLLKQKLAQTSSEYDKVKLVELEELRDDLAGDDATIVSTLLVPPRDPLKSLFMQYLANPSLRAILPEAQVYRKVCRIHQAKLDRHPDLSLTKPILMTYPMLYTINADPLGISPERYIAILWYGHYLPDYQPKNAYQPFCVKRYEVGEKEVLDRDYLAKLIQNETETLYDQAALNWLNESINLKAAFKLFSTHYYN